MNNKSVSEKFQNQEVGINSKNSQGKESQDVKILDTPNWVKLVNEAVKNGDRNEKL